MFSGIVEHLATVESVLTRDNACRLSLATPYRDLVLGESIAINGVCLTVAEFTPELCWMDVSSETLASTTLSQLTPGQAVNVERALCFGQRVGGHLVSGHVDGCVHVSALERDGEFLSMTFSGVVAAEHSLLVKKGSVAINGVSLTINDVNADSFSVMLIIHTLKMTNLGVLAVGDKVNIEYDAMVKAIRTQVSMLMAVM